MVGITWNCRVVSARGEGTWNLQPGETAGTNNPTWNYADFQEIPVQLLIYEEPQQLKSGRIRLIFKELDKNVPQNIEC